MKANLGMVLGSGLGEMAAAVEVTERISFAEAQIPASRVPGHKGEFIKGTIEGIPLIMMCGRIHLYEGHSASELTTGIRWMAEQGVLHLILTNAAGSLRIERPPGTWMLISDHLNLTGTSPLEGGANFVDMTSVYDADWGKELSILAEQQGWELPGGVYAGLRGPQYETPAEIRMLQTIGADAVGMSTVLEAMEACRLKMKVLGLSCLTNYGAGLGAAELDHSDVVETGLASGARMIALLREWLRQPSSQKRFGTAN